jgi:hypothetical protein
MLVTPWREPMESNLPLNSAVMPYGMLPESLYIYLTSVHGVQRMERVSAVLGQYRLQKYSPSLMKFLEEGAVFGMELALFTFLQNMQTSKSL